MRHLPRADTDFIGGVYRNPSAVVSQLAANLSEMGNRLAENGPAPIPTEEGALYGSPS